MDQVLGTSALVRLIRVLVYDVDGPVSVTDAARMAGLSIAGARKSLETLEKLGVASRVGTGRAQKFAPREGNPYMSLLYGLFEQEQRQYEDVLQELRQAVGIPEIRDAWLQGLPDEPSHTLELVVVADVRSVNWIGPELRTRLIEVEKRFDLIIEISVFTRADAPVIPDDAEFIWGMGGGHDSVRSHGIQTHAESKERALRMARAIAELIKTDPSLIKRALQYINRLLHEGQGTADSDLGEWRQLLETYSPERLRDLLVSQSPRADRLRRSSPFFSILNANERDRIFQELETSH